MKTVENYASSAYQYAINISKLRLASAVAAGVIPGYYAGAFLVEVIGTVGAACVGVSTGATIGLVTVYFSEKSIRKNSEIKKISNKALTITIEKDHEQVIKNRAKIEYLRLEEIRSRSNQQIYRLLRIAAQRSLEKKPISESDLVFSHGRFEQVTVKSSSALGGARDSSSRPLLSLTPEGEPPQEDSISESTDNQGYCEKFKDSIMAMLVFIYHSTRLQRCTMVEYGFMIGFYVEVFMTNVLNLTLTWGVIAGAPTGLLCGPAITYLTAKEAHDEYEKLCQEETQLSIKQESVSKELKESTESVRDLERVSIFTKDSRTITQLRTLLPQGTQEIAVSSFLSLLDTAENKATLEIQAEESDEKQAQETKMISSDSHPISISTPHPGPGQATPRATPRTPLLQGGIQEDPKLSSRGVFAVFKRNSNLGKSEESGTQLDNLAGESTQSRRPQPKLIEQCCLQ